MKKTHKKTDKRIHNGGSLPAEMIAPINVQTPAASGSSIRNNCMIALILNIVVTYDCTENLSENNP